MISPTQVSYIHVNHSIYIQPAPPQTPIQDFMPVAHSRLEPESVTDPKYQVGLRPFDAYRVGRGTARWKTCEKCQAAYRSFDR